MEALEQLRQHPNLEWSFLAPSAATRTLQANRGTLGWALINCWSRPKVRARSQYSTMIDELEAPRHLRQGFTVGYTIGRTRKGDRNDMKVVLLVRESWRFGRPSGQVIARLGVDLQGSSHKS